MEAVRVLVVEDDADHAELIRRTLTRHKMPFAVTVVGDGQACLEALARAHYSIVLLDYSLPGLNGVEILERMRRQAITVPVVMVTGQGDERIAVTAMTAGGMDYVVKTSGYLAALPTVLYKVLKQHELALENSRLHEETQRRLRESEALLELAQSLTSTLEYRPLLRRIAAAAARACEMDRCTIFVWEDERVVPVMSQFADGHADEELWRAFLELGHLRVEDVPFLAETVRRGEPVVVNDPDTKNLGPSSLAVFEAKTLLALPLRRQEAVIGALVLDNTVRSRPVTPQQVRLGLAVASQVALALDNARLYRDAQQALTELKAAQEQLVRGETFRALGELAGGVAHHLNNLLAVIVSRVDLLFARSEADPLRRHLTLIHRAAKDGAEVVRRIQEFARVERVHQPQSIDLNELVREVIEMTRVRWQDEARAHGVSIEVVSQAGPIPPVAGHPGPLREVIMNLMLNAVDALPGGGRVTLRTRTDDDTVVLSVEDNGIGMAEAVLRRAREPFFTTKGLKSTGLGLSVSSSILHRHGGDLTIDSVEGRGTTVTVRLPAQADRAVPGLSRVAAGERKPSLSVLIIDDEEDVREALGELLEVHGHTVMLAAGPTEGLKRLEAEPLPDVVLTDLGMPEMTGWELAVAIKRRWPELKVGLITGWGQEHSPRPEERSAVDFVLGKPVSVEALQENFTRARAAQNPEPTTDGRAARG